jgi:hypothetical protein
MYRAIALSTALILGACGQVPPALGPGGAPVVYAPPSSNPVISRSIVGAEQALTLAETAAMAYVTLPRCGVSSTKLCSDTIIVRKLRSLESAAYNAVIQARQNEQLIDFAMSAIQTFQSAIPRT